MKCRLAGCCNRGLALGTDIASYQRALNARSASMVILTLFQQFTKVHIDCGEYQICFEDCTYKHITMKPSKSNSVSHLVIRWTSARFAAGKNSSYCCQTVHNVLESWWAIHSLPFTIIHQNLQCIRYFKSTDDRNVLSLAYSVCRPMHARTVRPRRERRWSPRSTRGK